ncbi:RyR domain-containing protein [Streptomyces sp. NPDC029674]|uniref:RyR domain-containing protein n=1 Tax=Streptomyces sp. NPDC029674 TaxID=3365297 RepID=UPI00384DDFB9
MRFRVRRRHRHGSAGWVPDPPKTDGVEVPESLHALVEVLAEHAHDNWARQRMAEGWRHGRRRSDRRRTHPLLVPYADLTYEEQETDRLLALETVRLILLYGYRFGEPDPARIGE